LQRVERCCLTISANWHEHRTLTKRFRRVRLVRRPEGSYVAAEETTVSPIVNC
jgi:hypothetical protein